MKKLFVVISFSLSVQSSVAYVSERGRIYTELPSSGEVPRFIASTIVLIIIGVLVCGFLIEHKNKVYSIIKKVLCALVILPTLFVMVGAIIENISKGREKQEITSNNSAISQSTGLRETTNKAENDSYSQDCTVDEGYASNGNVASSGDNPDVSNLPNDMFLNVLYNPNFSLADFVSTGLTKDNTYIRDIDFYRTDRRTLNKMNEYYGRFDEESFKQYYARAVTYMNQLACKSQDDIIVESGSYSRCNIFAPIERVRTGPDIGPPVNLDETEEYSTMGNF